MRGCAARRGHRDRRLRAVGGGSKSDAWVQICADILGGPLCAPGRARPARWARPSWPGWAAALPVGRGRRGADGGAGPHVRARPAAAATVRRTLRQVPATLAAAARLLARHVRRVHPQALDSGNLNPHAVTDCTVGTHITRPRRSRFTCTAPAKPCGAGAGVNVTIRTNDQARVGGGRDAVSGRARRRASRRHVEKIWLADTKRGTSDDPLPAARAWSGNGPRP